MDQQTNNNELIPYKLPEVQADVHESTGLQEMPQVKGTTENQLAKTVENGTGGTSTLNPALIPLTPMPNPILTSDPGLNVAAQSPIKIQVSTDDLTAGDGDLIEKAWVVKAKEIVAQTKDDPYQQNNEIKKVKADYQLKRFNNKLKIENE